MLNFNSLLLFSENPKGLADFYKKVFESEPAWSGGDFVGFEVGGGEFMIGPHDKVRGKNSNPERIMFNFETEDVKGEFERIKGLGAGVVAEPYNPKEDPDGVLATFADPDGNYFQIASPFKK